MVIKRSDLTNEAHENGIWNALCEAAGIEPEYDRNQEITITRIEGED